LDSTGGGELITVEPLEDVALPGVGDLSGITFFDELKQRCTQI